MSKISTLLFLLISIPAWAAPHGADLDEMKRIQDANSKTLADTVQALQSLQAEVQAIRGALEENRHFFEQEAQKNAGVLRDYDLRLTGMEEKLGLYESQLRETGARVPVGGPATQPASAAGLSDEEALYRKAMAEMNAQGYKTAISLFDSFLKKYPKSLTAGNAQYWKAEGLYALKQYPEAVLEFEKVVRKYPKSEKVPAAILKQGYGFFEVKEYMDAKAFLQKVVSLYPKSEEAIKAREKIQQIDRLLSSPAGRKK